MIHHCSPPAAAGLISAEKDRVLTSSLLSWWRAEEREGAVIAIDLRQKEEEEEEGFSEPRVSWVGFFSWSHIDPDAWALTLIIGLCTTRFPDASVSFSCSMLNRPQLLTAGQDPDYTWINSSEQEMRLGWAPGKMTRTMSQCVHQGGPGVLLTDIHIYSVSAV